MQTRRDARLSVATLLPPLAALSAQWVSYSIVHQSCEHQSKLALILVKLSGAAACLFSFLLARGAVSELDETSRERARFQSISGQVLAAFFLLVIAAMGIPDIVLRVCD